MVAVHIEQGRVSLRDVSKPKRSKGQAVLKLVAGGVCNTDLELVRGYYGFKGTPGHEFVAVVVDADSAKWMGKRVVGEINAACGACEWCLRGLGRHCPQRTVLGIVNHAGAFQEQFVLPEANLLEVPAKVPTDHAVFTEPIAAACEILEQTSILKDEPVAVLGDGKLGLLIAQVLSLHGAAVTLYGRHPEKMAIAESIGVKVELTGGQMPVARYGKVVEATGSAEALDAAVRMTRPRGTVILKSTVHKKARMDMAPVIVNEITLVGSRCGRFEAALKLLRSGGMNLAPMIHARFPLSEAPRAFQRAAKKGTLKVLIDAAV